MRLFSAASLTTGEGLAGTRSPCRADDCDFCNLQVSLARRCVPRRGTSKGVGEIPESEDET